MLDDLVTKIGLAVYCESPSGQLLFEERTLTSITSRSMLKLSIWFFQCVRQSRYDSPLLEFLMSACWCLNLLARKDSVDYVIHLGDYIYEYKNGDYGWGKCTFLSIFLPIHTIFEFRNMFREQTTHVTHTTSLMKWTFCVKEATLTPKCAGQSIGRIPLPDRTIFTLYDYRKRIATYRTDLDLLLSHQAFPWIPVWDDHEVADNTYRDGSSGMYIWERRISFLFGTPDMHRQIWVESRNSFLRLLRSLPPSCITPVSWK